MWGFRGAALLLLALLPGCTLRLGGPRPVDFSILAVRSGPEAPSDPVRASIARTGADVVFLLAPRDEGWFAGALPDGVPPAPTWLNPGAAPTAAPDGAPGAPTAATRAAIGMRETLLPDSARSDRLPPLRPPPRPPTLRAETVGRVRERTIHLMAASFPAGDRASVADAATDLLAHIASQVQGDAVVVVAVALEVGADGDVLDDLVGAYLRGAGDCDIPGDVDPGLRLYYAPVALVECLHAEPLDGGSGILLRLRTRG